MADVLIMHSAYAREEHRYVVLCTAKFILIVLGGIYQSDYQMDSLVLQETDKFIYISEVIRLQLS
jgi:hypothetical protein